MGGWTAQVCPGLSLRTAKKTHYRVFPHLEIPVHKNKVTRLIDTFCKLAMLVRVFLEPRPGSEVVALIAELRAELCLHFF